MRPGRKFSAIAANRIEGRAKSTARAAVGAATGGVIGGIRRRDQQAQQAQAQAQQSQQYQAELERQRQNYHRAYSACLEGRGWTAVIDKISGKMVASAAGSQAGFLVFGACTSLVADKPE